MKPAVQLLLDMREYHDPPADAAGYRTLWLEIEREFLGRDLRHGGTVLLDRPGRGRLTAVVVDGADSPPVVDAATTFAICGLLEPPRLRYRCGACGDAGRRRYGPFVCTGCGTADPARRVCDDHVVILDLTFSRATCPAHVPSCGCGRTATFWCPGPRCTRRRAWCDSHRRRHPGDPLTSYCGDCYDKRFPACATAGCASTGSLACEFAAGGGVCGSRACPRHGFRWQVYGPHRRGLVLCADHQRRLPALSREDLVLLILNGTRSRRRGTARHPKVPRLSMLRHIFINAQRRLLSLAELQDVLEQAGGTDRALQALLHEHRPGWREEVTGEENDRSEGLRRFTELQRILGELGHAELAARVSMSVFKPRSGDLWVRVPEELRPRFIGKQGSTIKEMQRRLGLTVKLERL